MSTPDPTPDLTPDLPPGPTRPRPDDGRSRAWRALARPTRGQAVVGVLLALVGFAGVTQVRTNTVDDTYAGLRQQDLIDVLNGLASTTQRAQGEIQRLERARDDLQSDTDARRAALAEARNQVDTLSILAGTVPVQGPGISITVDDGDDEVQVGSFIDLVQALRNAGAEAMQVVGEGGRGTDDDVSVRVVAQTAFEDSVGGLDVGGTLIEPPYTIDVIGSPDALAAALRFPDGPQDQFAKDGAELTWEDETTVLVDTVTDPGPADFVQAQR